jgi:hypothetical protein
MHTIFKSPFVIAACVAQAALFAVAQSVAQTQAPAAQPPAPTPSPTQRTAVPEGAPVLAKDLTINQSTSTRDERAAADSNASAASSEEKIENRLAVIRSGAYVVTDPNVGRYDRATSNGVKRVSPSMWELLRF